VKRRIFAVLLISGMLLVAMAVGVVWFSGASEPLREQVSVRIELGQIEARKVGGFDWISFPGCSHVSVQGHPALPIKSVVVKLPRNTVLVEISVAGMTSVGVPGRYMVAPALKPRVISDDAETKVVGDGSGVEVPSEDSLFSEPLSEIYDSSISYPAELFDFYSSRGREYNYVMIYFYPVKFSPLEGGLTLIDEATFDVEYTTEAEGAQPLVDPSLDEVIVTAPAYETEANNLAAWRNATQVRTSVFNTSWIYSNYGGVDNPEKIRNFIGDMFNNRGINYVLLFGDVDDVPTRFAYVPDGDDAGGPDGIEVPTDYYYECLEGTWDTNGDGKYADLASDNFAQIDFIPDVSVGRLSVDGTTAGYVVDKIIEYEKNIDSAWSDKIVLAGTDPFKDDAGAEGEILKDYVEGTVQGNFTEFTKLYETLGNLSASAISNNINLGCGGVNFAGHGNYGLWSLEGAGYYTNSDAAGLTNGNKLPLVATMACLTAGFDSMYNTGNCIGEEFLRNPNGGTAAYVGATRTAWGYVGAGITAGLAGELDWRFWESYELGITQPGPMLSEAKVRYIASHPLNTLHDGYYLDEKTVLEYVLLGDPVLFAEKPVTLVETYKDLAYSEESKFFTVNDVVCVEADVRGYAGGNISGADVYAELYVDGGLEANITLAHLGGGSSLYRGSWSSGSFSRIGVYLVNVTVSGLYESAFGSSRFHLYSGSGVSAYRLDWNENGQDDYVFENEHLVSVFDGTEYSNQLIIYLCQKDTGVAYTFTRFDDADSIGKGEATSSYMKNLVFYSTAFSDEGENLDSVNLEMKTNVTIGLCSVYNLKNTSYPVWYGSVTEYPITAGNVIPGVTGTLLPVDENYIYLDTLDGNILGIYGTNIYPYKYVRFEIQEPVETIDELFVGWWGYGERKVLPTSTYAAEAYVYNYTLGDWVSIGTHTSSAVTEISANFTNGIGSLIDANGYLYILAANPERQAGRTSHIWTDYIMAETTSIPTVTTSFNLTVKMQTESVDYLVYRVHNFDENISEFSDFFSDIAGTLGLSVDDDRYHLEDGTDGLITSLTADQWNDYAVGEYVCVYDNSSSVDAVDDVVLAWVRFNESASVVYENVGLWNDSSYAAEGLRIRYNASQASATDETTYLLVFTKGDWETIHEWISTIESGLYPDPNFAKFPPPDVYLLVTVEPIQATYSIGQTVTFTVNVFNQKNYALEATLALTASGPGDYYVFDFDGISVAADAVGEFGFGWVVPDFVGTYVVEVCLVPPQLTAYDAVWLEAA